MGMYAKNKIIWLLIFSLSFLLTASTELRAQIQQQGQQANEQRKMVLTPVQRKMLKRITVDFRETPIEDVLRSMAKQADIDIVKSPRVVGEVTAMLTDVPLDEALTNILSAHGYVYISSENMIRVVTKEEIATTKEMLVNKIYSITYADAEEVYNALRRFISKEGDIAYNKGTSNLMVREVESKIKDITRFIEEVDRRTAQIIVEARIYDITSSGRLDLGIEWTAGRNTTFGNGLGGLGGVSGDTDPFGTGIFSGTTNQATNTNALIRFGILNGSVNIDAIIRAEQEDVSAKLLASPRIMVIDNEEAMIKIVEEIPFQELTETAAGGNIGTTEFRDVGVELTVRPHLTKDEMIRLYLNPIFKVNTGEVVIPGINNPLPQPIISTREAKTTTLIKSGQTVVIGGLHRQDILKQENKIPLLGDLPLLGGLFRFEGERVINSELVVFITPRLVTQPGLTSLEAEQFEDTKYPPPESPTSKLMEFNTPK